MCVEGDASCQMECPTNEPPVTAAQLEIPAFNEEMYPSHGEK